MMPKLPPGFSQPVFIDGGGFARVYRVYQKALDRFVAVKIIQEQDASKRGSILREATTQARLKIDCVPQVYDAFEKKTQVYIIMQFIFGTNLSDVLNTPLSQEQRCTIAQHIIYALAKLHSHGYAHRDLKPKNILISPEMGVYLIDFGFSKNVITGDKSIEEYVKGTPAYMAPELWRVGPNVDLLKVDLYALGLIIKEVLGGYIPEVITSCISENPAVRPENAGTVFASWQTQIPVRPGRPDWEGMTQPAASRNLAQRLFESATDLIKIQRYDEAYWLLVECLKIFPDMPEAFALMRNFPRFTQKKKKKQLVTILSVALGIAVLISGLFFLRTRDLGNMRDVLGKNIPVDVKKGYTKLSVPKRRTVQAADNDYYLRTFSDTTQEMFAGEIIIADFPHEGAFYINTDKKELSRHEKNLFTLAGGTYTLLWKNPENAVVWREQLLLLPFQTVALTICNR